MPSLAPRPGAALGSYPERRDPRRPWLERVGSSVFGGLRQRLRSRPAQLAAVVARIEERGAELRDEGERALLERRQRLRQALAAQGLVDELAIEAFALVREVSGRTLGMRHFDVQLVGGWIMLQGMLAEMQTGEGKTLTATLPACAAALAGIPVHVITSNDYLVSRDAAEMRPVYEALGLSVGAVTEDLEDFEARRAAYACDVTYCTNKQVTFDYLRDRVVLGNAATGLPLELERLHQDDARLDRVMLRGLCFAIVDEADNVLIDEARTPLILSRSVRSPDQELIYRQALQLARRLEAGEDFVVERSESQLRITDVGRRRLGDLAAPLEGVWSGERRRGELVQQALAALHLFERDKHYLVRDGKVEIIDPHTGRTMADRAWERGLHQLIETKEGVELSGNRETLARMSYQRFFRRYLRLAGMSGTAHEVRRELWSVYRLFTVTVPTHRPSRRIVGRDRVYASAAEKWRAVMGRIRQLHGRGRPVLVGTTSVAASEQLSGLLQEAGLEHDLLNARQDEEEAAIVARAGRPGGITVATNMAGRGTDIRLEAEVAEHGGLHVIATERNEARRIDRQLFGRCGRQGDPGSHEALLSLDDELVQNHYGPRRMAWLRRRAELGLLGTAPFRAAQRAAERRHARMRRELLRRDEDLERLLAFSGPSE